MNNVTRNPIKMSTKILAALLKKKKGIISLNKKEYLMRFIIFLTEE